MKRSVVHGLRPVLSEGGFTVFEFAAASLILFVVLMGVLGAVEYAGAATKMAATRQAAIDVATTQIEADRNLPWASLGLVYANGWVGDPAGTVPATQTITTPQGTFSVSTSILWARDTSGASLRASYKRIRVTVGWASPTAGSLAVETNIFGKSTTGNTGIVQVHARDVDNPTTPVGGVNIGMTPYGSASPRVVTTDSLGIALWNDVPVGNATFPSPLVLNPNWLVDVAGLGTQTIASGFKDIGYVDCQRPATARIHVHSTSITNYVGAKVTLTDTDRSIQYVGYTGSDGYVTFSQANGDVNGGAGLWKSKSGGYTAVATAGAATSNTGAFLISTSGQAYTGLDLAMPDPPSITVSKKISSTNATITAVPWTCTLRDPGNNVVTTYSGTGDSFTVAISTAGVYTASVTGMTGYLDGTATLTANTTTPNQPLNVLMRPLYVVGVKTGTSAQPTATVTVTSATGVSAVTTGGATSFVTGQDGLASFVIPAYAGNYTIKAVVNGQPYFDTATLDPANPSASIDYMPAIPASTISVTCVVGTTSSWTRRFAGVWDSSKTLVAVLPVTYSSTGKNTVTFTLPGGDYYIAAGGGGTTYPPIAMPTSGSSWSGALTTPYLPPPKSTIPTLTSGSLVLGTITCP